MTDSQDGIEEENFVSPTNDEWDEKTDEFDMEAKWDADAGRPEWNWVDPWTLSDRTVTSE